MFVYVSVVDNVSDAIVACALLHVRSLMWQETMAKRMWVKLHWSWRYFRDTFLFLDATTGRRIENQRQF